MSFDLLTKWQVTTRQSDYPVDPLFTGRWSSRALTGEPIPETDLYTCFEAARWAPSAFNAQPWRFIFAHRDGRDWDALFALLNAKNQSWAHKASALIFVISRKDFVFQGQTVPVGSHSFDTGAAWGAFAHQAHLLGYSTRAIGGFDRKAAPEILAVPDNHHVEAAIAIGRRADLTDLPETFHAQETPSERRPLQTFVFEGRFTSAE
ncbi:nitroreductase family protein [Asticcacaulis machinosus]|uniref:Nitroreductase family protein n=1 Tax=Asticcacaulis machinosus TaxID=2984211 RepID=A0ABT5HJT2_9CAUL|nr:nitroreductase family protein [Asticcacaulis machinosus]MDC7676268.1 nitroreductase family protein [Asticcacaulis machinosus]